MVKKSYEKKRYCSNEEENADVVKKTKTNSTTNARAKPSKENQFGSGKITSKETEKIIRKGSYLPDIKKIERGVLQCIIGQDKQVRQMITSIYRAINFKTIKSNVLIIGNSGTGKTETIKQIAKRLNIPYTIEDATKYTQEGYYGADVSDMIYNLLDNAKQDIKKAQNGIIIIDEIDKKAGHEEKDVAGAEVLKSLLKIIEGTIIKIPKMDDPFDESMINFDTKNIIVVFLGAFSGLDKIRDKRLNSNPLGFYDKTTSSNLPEQKARFLKQDLVQYGMPEEFVGRIDTIIEMNKLKKEDLALILRKSKLSIFKRYQAELKKEGIKLSYNKKIFESIAEESLALDTGARELSNTVNHIFENILYDIIANPGQYTKCTLLPEIVQDNTKYELS